jgi:hypothetical protein
MTRNNKEPLNFHAAQTNLHFADETFGAPTNNNIHSLPGENNVRPPRRNP